MASVDFSGSVVRVLGMASLLLRSVMLRTPPVRFLQLKAQKQGGKLHISLQVLRGRLAPCLLSKRDFQMSAAFQAKEAGNGSYIGVGAPLWECCTVCR